MKYFFLPLLLCSLACNDTDKSTSEDGLISEDAQNSNEDWGEEEWGEEEWGEQAAECEHLFEECLYEGGSEEECWHLFEECLYAEEEWSEEEWGEEEWEEYILWCEEFFYECLDNGGSEEEGDVIGAAFRLRRVGDVASSFNP